MQDSRNGWNDTEGQIKSRIRTRIFLIRTHIRVAIAIISLVKGRECRSLMKKKIMEMINNESSISPSRSFDGFALHVTICKDIIFPRVDLPVLSIFTVPYSIGKIYEQTNCHPD